jgi:isopentenyl diphosphate isomerase/L-lactate dehydrogenase-like FMN-dependent dehydrogenase
MNEETRKRAKERMKGFCRVCPRCNGLACGGEAVEEELLRLRNELAHAMLMTGCPRLENISSSSLARP